MSAGGAPRRLWLVGALALVLVLTPTAARAQWAKPFKSDLYEANAVTYEDALRNADSVNDLRLQIKLHSHRARSSDLSAGTEHLSIV